MTAANFGGDHRVLPTTFEALSKHAFGLAIAFCRIEKGDTRIERGMHRGDRHIIVLLAPNITTSKGPATQSYNRNIDIRAGKFGVFHDSLLPIPCTF